ncbi:heterokaryon incompatibility protein-domain-containing protein [Xylariomycetidae sp. FL0641]|nr:heterokaryon incompatibility protein-domain-containing protein [Xylariomycetidae sp. FL0641]
MRLIHTKTLELEDFSHGIPPYAILSHTWEYDQEISFQEWQQDRHNVCDRTGYTKIQNACAQAQQRGLDYLWVDTNCIDKSSSAELSEAINSMFSWYQQTQVCFVYLSDVTTTAAATLPAQSMTCGEEPPPPQHSPLSEARWWSRGWTLQELLAPNKLVFFSGSWEPIGVINKADGATSKNTPYQDFTTSVSAITGIGRVFLLGLQSLSEASIALRMSWAASRVTTRVEDMSYCLMGLFGINMPLLYGEGERAFQRLQHLIMGVSTDQSIFAWEWTQNTSYKEGLPHRQSSAEEPVIVASHARTQPHQCREHSIQPAPFPLYH